jgi:hypothetical protein
MDCVSHTSHIWDETRRTAPDPSDEGIDDTFVSVQGEPDTKVLWTSALRGSMLRSAAFEEPD